MANTLPETLGLFSNYDQSNILVIGDQPYIIEVWMYNQLAKFQPFSIPIYFIEELIIEEELHNWYISGSITLVNDYEILERGALSQTYNYLPNSVSIPQQQAPFLFRSDGRNKIAIRIKPVEPKNITLSDKQWQMSYDCIVYEIEDLNTDNPQKKLKKLRFIDERYQIFLERNIEWSTALYNNGKNLANASGTSASTKPIPNSDITKTMASSEAIKSLISTAASYNSSPDGQQIKVGSSKGPKGLNNPTNAINNFSSNWDSGSSDSYVIYTSPANFNVLEDIGYVFGCLKASDGSPLFLRLDRYDNINGKQFSLIPLSQYFKLAQSNQIERLTIQDGVDASASPPYQARAPINYTTSDSNIVNFQSPIASRISSYEFIPMTTADDFSLNNNPRHSFDFSNSQFNIEFKGNKVTDMYQNIQSYTNGLYGYKQSNQLILNINQTKQKGLTMNNTFVARNFIPKQMAGVEMMSRFLLLNQAISFIAPGLTLRSPGNFVFIDRDTSTAEKNPFDDKALGQWMITKVNHMFTKNSYINHVIGVKVDAYNKWWDVLDPVSTSSPIGLGSNNY
jgi:hypothetical protein